MFFGLNEGISKKVCQVAQKHTAHRKTLFLRGFTLKPKESSSKNDTSNFKNRPLFERSACFYVTVTEYFERFLYLNFEINFLKNINPMQKTEVTLFSESTKIENATFPQPGL